MTKRAHYGYGDVYTPSAGEVRELQAEHELFDAFNEGIRCAELAAKRIGYQRQEGRWVTVGLMIERMRQQAKALGRDKQKPPLLDINGMRMN